MADHPMLLDHDVTSVSPTPVYQQEIIGPSAWTRSVFAGPRAWTWRLSSEIVLELEQVLFQTHKMGKHAASLTIDDFARASLHEDAFILRQELIEGRGFVLVKGLDLSRYTEADACLMFWGVGTLLGIALPQNVNGERLFTVRNEGYDIARDWGRVGVRLSKTAEGLDFHTDSAPAIMGITPDVVGLFMLRVAQGGGASALVSACTVHNNLLRERPDYLERLYGIYHFDRRAEARDGESLTFAAPIFRYDKVLNVRYLRFYITQEAVQELSGVRLTDIDIEALDYLDAVMNRSELQVIFMMEAGDILLLNNKSMLHGRTRFTDHEDIERRRHMKRLWLSLER